MTGESSIDGRILVISALQPGFSEEYRAGTVSAMFDRHPHVSSTRTLTGDTVAWAYEMKGEYMDDWTDGLTYEHPDDVFGPVDMDVSVRAIRPLVALEEDHG